jgi:hypothetical protein
MAASAEMSRLLTAMRDELGDWASASDRLEHVIGDVLVGRSLTEAEIEAVQALDGLSQHLRQLSQLCGDISGVSADHREAADHIRGRRQLSGTRYSGSDADRLWYSANHSRSDR